MRVTELYIKRDFTPINEANDRLMKFISFYQIENLRRINFECDYIPLKHDFDSAYVDMYAAIEAMLGETTRLNIQGV